MRTAVRSACHRIAMDHPVDHPRCGASLDVERGTKSLVRAFTQQEGSDHERLEIVATDAGERALPSTLIAALEGLTIGGEGLQRRDIDPHRAPYGHRLCAGSMHIPVPR